MDDGKIIDMFFARNEDAIRHTDAAYGRRLYHLADRIVENGQDAEESVSDTYLTAWNTIPPRKPNILSAFLGKITRHISIDRWRKQSAQKRGGKEMIFALDELGECMDENTLEATVSQRELTRILNDFLTGLPETERNVFLSRYWYMDSIDTIVKITGFSQSKVTSMLHRTRNKLRKRLSEEGYV